MKTFSFNLCHYTITVTIEKKPYKTATEKSAEQHAYSFTGRNYDEALKPHIIDAKDVEFGEPVVYHGPFPGYESEEFKMEDLRSVEECFTEYIESQRGILSAATIKGYENVRDKHLDKIMVRYISRLDEAVIQRAFDEELAKGYSEKTIKGYKTLLMKVLTVYRPDLHPEIRITKETDDENA